MLAILLKELAHSATNSKQFITALAILHFFGVKLIIIFVYCYISYIKCITICFNALYKKAKHKHRQQIIFLINVVLKQSAFYTDSKQCRINFCFLSFHNTVIDHFFNL